VARQLRIGMIGAGGNARGHGMRLLSIPEVVVPAAADVNPDTRDLVGRMHPRADKVRFFKDYRRLLAGVKLDAVMISTPHTLHAEQILACLDKGLDVLCEKPLVCSVADARKVVARARQAKKILMVSYQRHLQGPIRFMREAVQSGEIGDVQFVQSFMAQGWLEATRGKWRQEPALSGGGQLNDSGSHILDAVMWITGLQAKRVCAMIDNFDVPVDINSALSVEYTNGAKGTFSILGAYVKGWAEQTNIIGSAGALHYEHIPPIHRVIQMRADGTPLEVMRFVDHGNPDQHFVDVIRGRCESDLGADAALNVIALTEAAWKSAAKAGAPVDVVSV